MHAPSNGAPHDDGPCTKHHNTNETYGYPFILQMHGWGWDICCCVADGADGTTAAAQDSSCLLQTLQQQGRQHQGATGTTVWQGASSTPDATAAAAATSIPIGTRTTRRSSYTVSLNLPAYLKGDAANCTNTQAQQAAAAARLGRSQQVCSDCLFGTCIIMHWCTWGPFCW